MGEILIARSIITMDDETPRAEAVAIDEGKVVALGSLSDLRQRFDTWPVRNDYANNVIIAGLIDQHLHPFLAATTLTCDVVAPEAWVLPHRTYAATTSPQDYDTTLRELGAKGEGWFFSWGYHRLWHGELSRERLDSLIPHRPVAVWQRSVHEWYLNSAAIEALDLSPATFDRLPGANTMYSLGRGHFWEAAMGVILGCLSPHFLTEERFRSGLTMLRDYLHMNGVTAINEPGIFWAFEPFALYQEILGAPETPFTTSFFVDGRSQALQRKDVATIVADAQRQVERAPEGKVALRDKHVKFFADGAIVSQLMQMYEPYLDADGKPDPHHHGEWLMEPEVLAEYFAPYWDAGWQAHIHVNGDWGLDVVLDVLDDSQRRLPRLDHRTTIVHFANSTYDQVQRIAKLGAIVSANPYYPVGFADAYSAFGLGPARADVMVRARDVLNAGIPLSYHSDLPIAPADPLALASFGVNRTTASGRVAGPEQCVSVHEALRAITIESAYSWREEHSLGSISVGKWANLTVLDADPYEVDPRELGAIGISAVIHHGNHHHVPQHLRDARTQARSNTTTSMFTEAESRGCACNTARLVTELWADSLAS